jgi:hypothetical protein
MAAKLDLLNDAEVIMLEAAIAQQEQVMAETKQQLDRLKNQLEFHLRLVERATGKRFTAPRWSLGRSSSSMCRSTDYRAACAYAGVSEAILRRFTTVRSKKTAALIRRQVKAQRPETQR